MKAQVNKYETPTIKAFTDLVDKSNLINKKLKRARTKLLYLKSKK